MQRKGRGATGGRYSQQHHHHHHREAPRSGGAWAVFDSFADRKEKGTTARRGGGAGVRSAPKEESVAMQKHQEMFAPKFSDGSGTTRNKPCDNEDCGATGGQRGSEDAEVSFPSILVGQSPGSNAVVSLGAFFLDALQRHTQTPRRAVFSAELECLRSVAMKQLFSHYESLLRQGHWPVHKTKGQREAFIRWVFERKAIEHKRKGKQQREQQHSAAGSDGSNTLISSVVDDPVIPGPPGEVSQSLLREVETDITELVADPLVRREKATALVLSTAEKSVELLQKFREVDVSAVLSEDRTEVSIPTCAAIWRQETLLLTKTGGEIHEILVRHGQRLHFLFKHFRRQLSLRNANSSNGSDDSVQEQQGDGSRQEEGNTEGESSESEFPARVYAMLERYRAITGVKPNEGSGHHASIPPQVHRVLTKYFDTSMEAFASPFNSYHSNYCSLFQDTDCHFGSVGSFFEFHPREGSFEVNPPFVEEVMEDMRLHIEELLNYGGGGREGDTGISSAEGQKQRPLSFAVVIPHWTDPVPLSTQTMEENKSGFLRRRIVVPADDHVYLDGFQHCLKDAPFKPVHDTLVLILQNEAGHRKWPAIEQFEGELLKEWKACGEFVQRPTFYGQQQQQQQAQASDQPQEEGQVGRKRERDG